MITTFLLKLTQRLNEYKTRMGLTYFREFKVNTTTGPKYTKVLGVEVDHDGKEKTRNIIAFIDNQTGDIFKPASFKAPAKHARGNVNSAQNGMEAISAAGHVVYLGTQHG